MTEFDRASIGNQHGSVNLAEFIVRRSYRERLLKLIASVQLSLLFISSGPPTDPSLPATTRFSPRRRQGVFLKRRLDLSTCHR